MAERLAASPRGWVDAAGARDVLLVQTWQSDPARAMTQAFWNRSVTRGAVLGPRGETMDGAPDHLSIRGNGELRQQHYEHAAQAFSFCLGQDPSAECFVLRGQALLGLGELDRALRDFNLAVERNPELAIAYHHRAIVHEKLGRLPAAQKDRDLAQKLRE